MLGKVTLTQLRLQVGVKESVFSHLFKYLSDFQMSCQPFKDPEFMSWLCRMRGANVRVSCVVELDDGKIEVCGNPVWGIQTLQRIQKAKRRVSLEWVPPVGNLKMLEKPLGEIFMNTGLMRKFAAGTLRHFIGSKVQFGSGDCMLWEHSVEVHKLKYSKATLQKVWNSPIIMIADIIDWDKFIVKSFGTKIKDDLFKIHLKWREMCVLIIEVAYNALGLDVDNIHGFEEQEHESNNRQEESDCTFDGNVVSCNGPNALPVRCDDGADAIASLSVDSIPSTSREPVIHKAVSAGEGGGKEVQQEDYVPYFHDGLADQHKPEGSKVFQSEEVLGQNDSAVTWMCELYDKLYDKEECGNVVQRQSGCQISHEGQDNSGSLGEKQGLPGARAYCHEEHDGRRAEQGCIRHLSESVSNVSEREDCVPEPEKLREDSNKILFGSLKDYCSGNNTQKMVVQIIEIIKIDGMIFVNVSDGMGWVKCSLDRKYYEQVESGELKKFDIIKNIIISGSGAVNSEFELVELCRPKSLQLKVPKLVGSPVPYSIGNTDTCRNKRKAESVIKRLNMPRVEELFDESSLNR